MFPYLLQRLSLQEYRYNDFFPIFPTATLIYSSCLRFAVFYRRMTVVANFPGQTSHANTANIIFTRTKTVAHNSKPVALNGVVLILARFELKLNGGDKKNKIKTHTSFTFKSTSKTRKLFALFPVSINN